MMNMPDSILELMWEYDEAALTTAKELPDCVLERVMTHGGLDAMRWLLRAVPRERMATFLETRGHRVLPPRELRFWCGMAGIGETRTSGWVEGARVRESTWR